MKKIMMTLLFFALVAAACNNAPTEENNSAENTVDNDQAVTSNEDDNDGTEEEADDQTDIEEAEPDESENNDDINAVDDNDTAENNQQSEDNKGEAATDDQSEEDQLRELGFNVFDAQKNEDYDYLESILAESASMDNDANKFQFEDIAYPHEMEFVEEDEDNLEYRFIHEDDEGVITVGFGVVDHETESSYTIDFQFVQENGEWKMKDMDKNA